ncbi:heavy-metal-associated domain-containing protein [Altererythrobacter sp. BO-6]|uniref:heavy-metal-associated domain-containing protein n=1 Tax=Altererythrobacter sp. BO-6 TaxID=2604537 RepID=UPI0013E18640|nr:heavy-metal-associated domain-containing protein [Altererythrobacter sp. BO-6]QIG55002.1 heavy-metal-associated domain-containing protein [Altererythrobacter sp. BO-6]
MTASFPTLRPLPTLPSRPIARFALGIAMFVALAFGFAMLAAQIAGDRGIAPVASTSDIDVGGVEVDVRGDDAEDAREKGWSEAQTLAWKKINGPDLPQSTIESMVSAVVIERELIGPKRYRATLGVVFDRSRAAQYLGSGERGPPSAPMLLLPVTASAGTFTMYEVRNPWQRAWAEFNPGTSRVNYVRPSGAGGESVLLNHGQTMRRSRAWWRVILDQFGAADVLVPVARLEYSYPGGPVKGVFTARYGPDNRYLDSFTMTADSPDALPEMLDQAVRRVDTIFQTALADGKLRPDPTLSEDGASLMDPAIARLIQIGRAIEAREAAIAAGAAEQGPDAGPIEAPTAVVSSYVVQFASPDAASIDATLAMVRSVPGVRGAATTSLAFGGTSVMTVSYAGTLSQLAGALRARGLNVQQGSDALLISR